MGTAAVICLGWLFSICLHEFGHALVAYKGGDTSVKDKGYLTLNIFKYTDPQVTLMFPIVILVLGGIALPGAAVYIDRSRLRNRVWQSAVSAAGPYASSLVALLFALPFYFNVDMPSTSWLMPGLAFLVLLQVLSVIFNLLPVPGFDGFGIVAPWLPPSMQRKMLSWGNAGLWVMLLAIWFVPGINELLWGSAYFVTGTLGVPLQLVEQGHKEFFANRLWIGVLLIGSLFIVSKANKRDDVSQIYRQAKQALNENHLDRALQLVDSALSRSPASAECWHLRALCLGLMQRNSEAIASFNRALAIKHDFPDCWYNKACCYAIQGQPDAALASLGQALAIKGGAELKEHARKDSGFASLRNDPRFQKLVG